MTKRNKKKAGLQRKVSSLFKSVSIPQRDGDPQTGGTPASDGTAGTSPKLASTDSLILQSSLMKKLLRSESSSNEGAIDHTKTVHSERTSSDHSASQDSLTPKCSRVEDKPDKTTSDHTVGPDPKLADLDCLIPKRSSTSENESEKIKASSDKTKKDRTKGVPPKLTGSADSIQKRAEEKEPSQTKNLLDIIKPDDVIGNLPEETAQDHPVSQQSPLEEPPQIEDMLDETEPGRFAETPSEQVVPDLPILQDPPVGESLQAKDGSNTATPDFEMSVPSWMEDPEYADSRNPLVDESTQSEDSLGKSELNHTVEDFRIAEKQSIPNPSSVKEAQETGKVSDKADSNKERWVPPKLTTPDRPISKDSSGRKTEQAKSASDKPEPGWMERDSQKHSIGEPAASQDSLTKKLYKTDKIPETSAPNRVEKASSPSKSGALPLSPKSKSGKRFGSQVPPKEDVSSTPFKMDDLPVASGPSLWQMINNKLFASQRGGNPTRRKVMMLSIPILAIILIFLFRQVLSKPPRTTKGAPAEKKAQVVQADSSQEIDWQIPESLPATMRDPAVLKVRKDSTQTEEQNQTPKTPKRKLVKIGTIVYSQDKPSAIVNGRIVHVGDKVNSVTILKINRDSVEFEKDGERWIQKMHE